MSKRLLAHIAVLIVSLIYGANYTIAKEVMGGNYLQPVGFIWLRVSFAVLVFWTLHQVWSREKIEWKDLGLLALCGLFGVAVNQSFFFAGLHYTTPINASLIMTTNPILVLLIAAAIGQEKITIPKFIGIVLGMSGAILIITNGRGIVFTGDQALGNLLVLINATSYGIYLILVKKLMVKYKALTVVKWVFLFGLIYISPIGLPQLADVDWNSFTTGVWVSIAYVLIFTTVLAYLLNAYALNTLQSTTVSIYIFLQPLFAAMVALSLGKESLTWIKLIAGLLILSGILMVTFRKQFNRNVA
ncbi:MAG: EamA family transporter [Saprospiraceae bacterium]|nr:EamA family transporter [Saprospiraceae bacterium]